MISRKQATIESLVGGLDTFVSETEIDDSATPDCLNVIPTGKGAITSRPGRVIHGGEITNGYSGQGYFIYVNTNSTIDELVIANGVLKKKNGNLWDTISGGTFSATNRVIGAQVGSRLYFADGVTALCYYDGVNIVTTGVANAPLPSFLIFYNRRIYCNDVNNKDRYYYGGAMGADGTVTNTGNFASVSPAYGGYAGFGLGRKVNGFGKFGITTLIIGLNDGLHRIAPAADSGTATALAHSEELISNSVGIVSHSTIDNLENDLAFLSWSDIYLVGEVASYSSIRTRTISARVTSLIQGISSSNIAKSAMLYSPAEKKLYLAYADGTNYNNMVLVYDVYYKSWWKYSDWHPAAFLEYIDASNERQLLYVSDNPSDSYCYQINTTINDAGAAIAWYWKSKILNLKGFDVLKKFKRWAILFGSIFGTITINVYIGGETNTSTIQLGSKSGSAGLGCVALGRVALGRDVNALVLSTIVNDWRWKKIARPNEGTNIQFKFSGSGVGEAGQIEKIKFYYKENILKKDRSKRIA